MSPASALLLGLWLPCAALAAAPAPDPAREFEVLAGQVTQDNHDESCARMQSWVDAHPTDAQAGRALIWMTKLRRADGRDDLARPLLERTLRDYPGTEWALNAIQGLADLDLKEHRYERAIAGYELLSREPGPLWSYVGQHAARYAREERLRFQVFLGVVAALVGLSLYRLWRSGGPRSLWPPPAEFIYPLPLPLLMLAASTALEVPEARTVVTLALSGMALLWLNGAYLRAWPPAGGGRAAQAALGVIQACALLYCAVVTNGLWEKLVDTLAMGAE